MTKIFMNRNIVYDDLRNRTFLVRNIVYDDFRTKILSMMTLEPKYCL